MRSKQLRKWLAALILSAIASAICLGQGQQPDPDSPRYKGVLALQDFLMSDGDESLKEFVQDRISPHMKQSMSEEKLLDFLKDLRQQFSGVAAYGARPAGTFSATILFDREQQPDSITFELESEPPHRFVKIELGK